MSNNTSPQRGLMEAAAGLQQAQNDYNAQQERFENGEAFPHQGYYSNGYGEIKMKALPQIPQSSSTSHPSSTPVLLMGILGIFLPIFPLVALLMGNNAKIEAQQRGQWRGALKIGWMLGLIFTILQLGTFLFTFFFIFFGLSHR